MSPDTQMVLTFILANPGVKNRTIANTLKLPLGTVNSAVTRLRKDGLVNPAVTDLESTFYGQCWPVESECPVQTAVETTESAPLTSGSSVGTTAEMPVDPGNTIGGAPATGALTSESGWGVPLAAIVSATPASPSEVSDAERHIIVADPAKPGSEFTAETLVIQPSAPGHFPLLPERIYAPTHPGMDENHLAALGAARELAGENAALKLQAAKLTGERDMYKHSHNAAAEQHSRLCKAFGLEGAYAYPEVLERVILAAAEIYKSERKAEKEAAEATRLYEGAKVYLRVARAERNALESDLAEISWLCLAAGFVGSGDAVDQFCWLLRHLGYPYMADAIPTRRRLQMEIRGKEQALQELVTRVRVGLPPETSDRCDCGDEARKVEGESGFTKCNGCYHQEGAE